MARFTNTRPNAILFTVLRRHGSRAGDGASAAQVSAGVSVRVVVFAGWSLDLVRRELRAPCGIVQSLTEGEFLLLRALLGISGNAVIANAVSPCATRTTWASIRAHLASTCSLTVAP